MDVGSVRRKILRTLGLKKKRMFIVQIELTGICNANCEYCDWMRRPKEQQVTMDTQIAKKVVREAIEMDADHISFHVTGEPLLHPDLFEIMPTNWNIGLSTNCLALEGEKAKKLAAMPNLGIVLAVLWGGTKEQRERSITNAVRFLSLHPVCKSVTVQMICSEHSINDAEFMYKLFKPYSDENKNVRLFYKQPYTQEPEYPTKGYEPPAEVIASERVKIDRMITPVSCGTDCLAIPPNPMTSILIQSDGELKPCFYRPQGRNVKNKEWENGWQMGNARDTTLQEFWNADKLKAMRKIWAKGDPDNQLPCHDCIRMVVPPVPVWWNTTGVPPTTLDKDQKVKGETPEPYPKPDE